MKKITINLFENDLDSVKTIDMAMRAVKAIVIPRSRLSNVIKSKRINDCSKSAIYFLFGEDDGDSILPAVYIGQTRNLEERLRFQANNLIFWQIAICFIKNDSNLDLNYLEARCIEMAKLASRCVLKNSQDVVMPVMPLYNFTGFVGRYLESSNKS